MNELATSALSHPLPSVPGRKIATSIHGDQNFSYQQTVLLARQSSISLTTAEGDRVSISADWSSATGVGISQARYGGALLNSYSLNSLETNSYSLGVEGDLNAEELRDIERLVDQLTKIAYDFFNGDMERALEGGLNLGELGSIRELSATFLQASYSSQQLTSRGPRAVGHLPASFGSQAAPPGQPPTVSRAYRHHDIIQAQWQQLKEWFEAETAGTGQAPLPPASDLRREEERGPSARMVAALEDTMVRHPRLTPLSRALAERAMERGAELFTQESQGNPPLPEAVAELRHNLGQRLDRWLLS
ncbi:MAG TPA: hypothetical protein ENN98_08060 [Desulfurivibrio alkaliphilus]|uniref:DUF5610 domain-containing protein n=1 Tax=Desulfurivibrio alkaliphilus TaxID=427923 RepID=A0A7C2Y0D6_9BACT|nr:hypothetical protein [Desulfurivibrio alkaliphilus]